MKRLLKLLLLLCLAFTAIGQQKRDLDQTKTNQVLSNYAGRYRQALMPPSGPTPGFPSYVADSSKCGALYNKTGGVSDTLMTYDCATGKWLPVGRVGFSSLGFENFGVYYNNTTGKLAKNTNWSYNANTNLITNYSKIENYADAYFGNGVKAFSGSLFRITSGAPGQYVEADGDNFYDSQGKAFAKQAEIAAMYAALSGANHFTNQNYFSNGSSEMLIDGGSLSANLGRIVFGGATPFLETYAGLPFLIKSGSGTGGISALNDSLRDSQGRQFFKEDGSGNLNLTGKTITAQRVEGNVFLSGNTSPGHAYAQMDSFGEIFVGSENGENLSLWNGSGGRPWISWGLGGGGFRANLRVGNVTSDRNWELPDASGTLALKSDLLTHPDSTTIANNYLSFNNTTDKTIVMDGVSNQSLIVDLVANGNLVVKRTGTPGTYTAINQLGISVGNSNTPSASYMSSQGFEVGRGDFVNARAVYESGKIQISNYSYDGVIYLNFPQVASGSGGKNIFIPSPTSTNETLAFRSDLGNRPDSTTIAGTYLKKSGGLMTGFPILPNANPTDPLAPAPKVYVDNAITGLFWKNAVRVRTTGNITLSGLQTIDGQAGGAYRVLVNSQTNPAENGIYDQKSGAWTRAIDADTGDEIWGSTVMVTNGTLYRNTQWTNINTASPTPGTDAITYGQISGAGTYAGSSGVNLSANVFTLDQSFTRGLFSASNSTGIAYNNSTGVFSLSSIPNASLANSTISGISLGNNLLGHSAGTGLTGSTYNGSTTQSWTANLSTGIAGGQTANGGTGAGENLVLQSTTNAGKGRVYFGSTSAPFPSFYDEVNSRLVIGATIPNAATPLQAEGISGTYRTGLYVDAAANSFGPTLVGYTNRDGFNRIFFTGGLIAVNNQSVLFGTASNYRMTYENSLNRLVLANNADATNALSIVQNATTKYNDFDFNNGKFWISNAGKVGVNTTTTTADFDVNGTGRFRASLLTAGYQASVVATKTANYAVTATDQIVPCNSTAGSFSITLLSSAPVGTIYTIDNIDGTANSVTVAGTINGATNYTLNALKSVTVYKTATATNTWKIIANN